jgi:chromate transporter
MGETRAPALPGLGEAALVWARIGLLSFGGPAGQIAMMHREVVEQRGWLGEAGFLRALSFCALLPGPEAQQLAIYLGWLMHGPIGGVVAGSLFVLPGAAVLLALSVVFVTGGQIPAIDGLFFGLKCAVLAMVVQALLRVAGRALRTRASWAVGVTAFLALNLFAAPFPMVVLAAGALGVARPGWFTAAAHGGRPGGPGLIERAVAADPGRVARQAAGARRAGVAALGLWLAPVTGLALWAPGRFAQIAWYFSKVAAVSFGGAYAALAYVAQNAVHARHWLTAPEMLTGLGLAETTPGPLVLVLQFVGFLAGYRAPGALTGMAGGFAAALLVLWVTFLPCFAFVFLGAPMIEALAAQRRLVAGLAAITAAVVGVIGNLALWFGLHVVFAVTATLRVGPMALDVPVVASLDARAAVLAAVASVLLFGLRWGALAVLALCAASGMALSLV